MNKPNPAPEPTMEEILASIRRIISDGDDGPMAIRPAPKPQLVDDEPDDSGTAEADIFDLTDEMVAEEPVAAAPVPAPAPVPVEPEFEQPDDAFDADAASFEAEELPAADAEPSFAIGADDLVDPDQMEVTFGKTADAEAMLAQEGEPAEDMPSSAEPPPALPPDQSAHIGLLSPQSDAMVASAFGRLATTILSRDARTLEDLVSEMMRPMLKEWLDDNLPVLVERLVREEIERVSRGRR